MKKLFAVLLMLTLSLALVSCGAINKDGEVSVLWIDQSDEYLATVADALDRAMYIENIKYTHYDAEGSEQTQLSQIDAAIADGAVALVVSTDSLAVYTEAVAKAQAAGLPIVFLCCSVELPAASYDKCVIVDVDHTSLYKTLGETVAEDLIDHYETYDRNDDGVITYIAFGMSAAAVPFINEKLTAAGKAELAVEGSNGALPTTAIKESIDAIFNGYDGTGATVTPTPAELILTDDDAYMEELLLALRAYELNDKKLVTHSIPLYTVGASANVGGLIDSKNEEELAAYSVMNAIDNGYLTAAALENDDALALSTAAILRSFIRGEDVFEGVESSYVSGNVVSVPYTIYE